MFKTIILCALYNLSDDQVEHQIRDRLVVHAISGVGSRGPGSRRQDGVAVPRTVNASWRDRGFIRDVRWLPEGSGLSGDGRPDHRRLDCGGTQTAQQPRGERADKGGRDAGRLEDKPAKRRQKDVEARWTKKHGKSHYGYKNHVNVDRRHKLVRRYHVSDAAEHDSQVLDDILDGDNTALGVWADSAYRSAEIEASLNGEGVAEPDPSQGPPQQAAERAREARQQDPFVGSGPRRACLRGPEQRHGRDAGA